MDKDGSRPAKLQGTSGNGDHCRPMRPSVMQQFVTRPDIRAPVLDITSTVPQLHPRPIGYWLLAPYTDQNPECNARGGPPQVKTGPYIFDDHGHLVWSGSHIVNGDQACDFKQSETGEFSLSIMKPLPGAFYFESVPMVLNSSLQLSSPIEPPTEEKMYLDPHEFILTGDDTYIIETKHSVNVTGKSPIMSCGFNEIDRKSGEVVFKWSSADHIPAEESYVLDVLPHEPLDYLHLNSIDKTKTGDYLLSGRFTNTIYLVSGRDGSIIWRLGGKSSSFELDGFNFSAQHDARLVPSSDPDITLLSFLDNASNGFEATSTASSALLVSLNHTDMRARSLRHHYRPDGGLAELRGNVQYLASGHMFVCWSKDGYISEYDELGALILEVRFVGPSLATYRAFRLESASWSTPRDEEPTLATLDAGDETSSFFVSWNGAHDVSAWRLFGCTRRKTSSAASPKRALHTESLCADNPGQLVEFDRLGFESNVTISVPAELELVFAQAMASSGELLGQSNAVAVHSSPSVITDLNPLADDDVQGQSVVMMAMIWVVLGMGLLRVLLALAKVMREAAQPVFSKPRREPFRELDSDDI
ncbi:hypothetical protein PRZ48_007238 [Zasmidium cellare]|uniref:ASST-domain-containing protein n=1 Tax=Zasmidium cellare TaxID=395010 RepID=A0ABR0EIT8_ZASCE|nr:hypothetical protein PRZ48_007238 [Zasmidium cellare]